MAYGRRSPLVLRPRSRFGGGSRDACALGHSLTRKLLYVNQMLREYSRIIFRACDSVAGGSGGAVATFRVVLTRALARFPLPSLQQRTRRRITRTRQELPRSTLFVHNNTELQLSLWFLIRAPQKLARSFSASQLPATSSGETFRRSLRGRAPGLP